MKALYYFGSIAMILLLISCREENPEPLLEWEYGKNEYNMVIDGDDRNFLIHVPTKYDGSEKVPAVFMLHGSSGNGTKFYNISRWVEKADEEGFIAVFPTAREYPVQPNGKLTTKWSSIGLENDVMPGTEILDDVPFFEELIVLISETFNINDKKLYISGFSNGGGFVKSVIVPRMGDVFAACSSSGGVGIPVLIDLEVDRIAPLHNISGTMDDRIMQSIGEMKEIPIKGSDLEAHDYLWNSIETMTQILSLSTSYSEQTTLPKYNTLTFSDNLSEQENEYVLVIIKDLQHNYANENNNPKGVVAVDIIWPWFSKWEL